MVKFFLISLGGALGAVARYALSGIDYRFAVGGFPLNTLVVNLAGSLVIGALWGVCESITVPAELRLFVFIGLLGGFTTFSAFALENFQLIRGGDHALAAGNIILSNALGVGFVFAGYGLARFVLNLFK